MVFQVHTKVFHVYNYSLIFFCKNFVEKEKSIKKVLPIKTVVIISQHTVLKVKKQANVVKQ